MSAKRKPFKPRSTWERPTQSAEEFQAEVAKRAESSARFGIDAAGQDFLENLHQVAIQGVNIANEGIRSGEDVEFHESERAFCNGIAFAVKAIRSGSIRRAG